MKYLILHWILVYSWLLKILANPEAKATTKDLYPLQSIDQCYGHRIPVTCPKGHLVQLHRADYRQANYCPGPFHSNFCSKSETGNPACVGEENCVFTTPWVYLSQECGYSNNFMVTYRCVPEPAIHRICESRLLRAIKGYIASPSYPNKYPSALNCALQILAPRGYQIRVWQVDLYLTYYNLNANIQCIDRLWITDGANNTGYLCSGQRREEIFQSHANKLLIKFLTSAHSFTTAKGFWLYFEAFPSSDQKKNNLLLKTMPQEHSSQLFTQSNIKVELADDTDQLIKEGGEDRVTMTTPMQEILKVVPNQHINNNLRTTNIIQYTEANLFTKNHYLYGTDPDFDTLSGMHTYDTFTQVPITQWDNYNTLNNSQEIVTESPVNYMINTTLRLSTPKTTFSPEAITTSGFPLNYTILTVQNTTMVENKNENLNTDANTNKISEKKIKETAKSKFPSKILPLLQFIAALQPNNTKSKIPYAKRQKLMNRILNDFSFKKWLFKNLFGIELPVSLLSKGKDKKVKMVQKDNASFMSRSTTDATTTVYTQENTLKQTTIAYTELTTEPDVTPSNIVVTEELLPYNETTNQTLTQFEWMKKHYYPLWVRLFKEKESNSSLFSRNNNKYKNTMQKKVQSKYKPVTTYKYYPKSQNPYNSNPINKHPYNQQRWLGITPYSDVVNTRMNESKLVITPSEQSSSALSAEGSRIKVGKKELGAIGGGIACLIVFVAISAVIVSFHKRCTYKGHKRKLNYRSKRNKYKNDIIMAYETNEADCGTLSSLAGLNLSTDNLTSYLPPYLKQPYGAFDHVQKRSLIDHMELMKTIDERPEDIYSHLKNNKTNWLKKMLIKKSDTKEKMRISKSADNLSDLYPSLERTLINDKDSVMRKHKKQKQGKQLMSSSYQRGLISSEQQRHNISEEMAVLSKSTDDNVNYTQLDLAHLEKNKRGKTYGSLTKKSKSVPDIKVIDQEDIASNHGSNFGNRLTHRAEINGGYMNASTTEDNTLDTENLSSIIDYTSQNGKQEYDSEEDPSNFTDVTRLHHDDEEDMYDDEHYASIDEMSMNHTDTTSYDGFQQQIPDNRQHNVVLTSYSTNSDESEKNDSFDNKEQVFKKFTVRYVPTKGQNGEEYEYRYEQNELNRSQQSARFVNKNDNSQGITDGRNHQKHNKSNPNLSSSSSKKSSLKNGKCPKTHRRTSSVATKSKAIGQFDSLRKARQMQQHTFEPRVHFTTPPKSHKKHTSRNSHGVNYSHIRHRPRMPEPVSPDAKKSHRHANPYHGIDLSTMNVQNELTSDSLDLSFVKTDCLKDVQRLGMGKTMERRQRHAEIGEPIRKPTHYIHTEDYIISRNPGRAVNSLKYPELEELTCNPYNTLRTIPLKQHIPNTNHDEIPKVHVKKHHGHPLPNNFSTLKRTNTLSGHHNWAFSYELNNQHNPSKSLPDMDISNEHLQYSRCRSEPGNHGNMLLCGSDNELQMDALSCQSSVSSRRSKKSHATLYSEIDNIEGIYQIPGVPNMGDIHL